MHLRSSAQFSLLAALLTLASNEVFAHTGVNITYGFSNGFGHPLAGLDHVLVMIAIGVFAANLGGRAVWLIPASFLWTMAVGGVLGMWGLKLPLAETVIAISVIVLGAAVALQWSLPIRVAMAMVGVFAVFHGYAHGAEMHSDKAGLSYAIGFVSATALLHLIGLGIGLSVEKAGNAYLLRALQAGGGLMAAVGMAILMDAWVF